MIEAADSNHVKLMIAYRLHFEEANLEAIQLAKSGKLGNVRIFDSAFSQQMVADNIRVTKPVRPKCSAAWWSAARFRPGRTEETPVTPSYRDHRIFDV